MYNTYMYALASQLQSLPVISLQTGETVAVIKEPLINPDDLVIMAYICTTARREQTLVLLVRDIREHALDCLIIDSEEELAEPGDLVRLGPLLKQSFTPLGKLAVTDMGRRMGRVENYTVNLDTDKVQKLYIRQPLWRSWFGSSLIIDRAQIIDVTPRQIVIRDTATPAPLMVGESAPKSTS
jgi:sporulation protein YlmC with PRC-barrel domain